MLSDLECIQQQTNIRIDDIAQIYATSNLDVTAHGAEYIRTKKKMIMYSNKMILL